MSEQRADPFADLSDFNVSEQPARKPAKAAIDQVAAVHGFPSREAKKEVKPAKQAAVAAPSMEGRQRRRYRTGRNQQFNIKATPETIDRFYKAAERFNVTALGELLDLALDALDKQADLKKRTQ